jgi:hypothetical protein
MRRTALVMLAVGTLLAMCVTGALATGPDMRRVSAVPLPDSFFPAAREFERGRADTIWLFDAHFNNTIGDNAWTSYDVSGTLGQTNYWHHDTIRTDYAGLGDSTWWCGKYDVCWLQPRGYGNLWTQYLWRDFTPQMVGVSPGALIQLTFNQRYAMEHNYDYGYVDVSRDGGATWDTTVATYHNPGYQGLPGKSQNWAANGVKILDLSAYNDPNLAVRFRFESGYNNSSQDQYNNPPNNSYKDGAWQLDNLTWKINSTAVWVDNCEQGNKGWQHPNIVQSGETGVKFWRGLYGTDIWTAGRDFTCGGGAGWMWAGVEPVESRVVDNEWTYLVSPAINVAGSGKLVGRWTMWVDLPYESGDRFDLWLSADDNINCVLNLDHFVDEDPGGWYGGPFWGTWTDNWDAFAGMNYLAIRWELANDDSATVPHMGGIFLAHQEVGEPTGDLGTTWNDDTWYAFNDWSNDQIIAAQADSARMEIRDDDGIASARLVVSDDAGATWATYSMTRETPEGNWWGASTPSAETVPGAVIRYYYSATDGVGNVSTYPSTAPDGYLEFSLLPTRLPASYRDLLLVDKHGRRIPGEDRAYLHSSEYYYREALGILGYEWDVYDVEVPSGTTVQSNGPDSSLYKYYDTQIWWFADFDAFTVKRVDQKRIIDWLSVASETKDRNLLLAGNEVGKELISAGLETLGFYETWLASDWVQDAVGPVNVDSVPGLIDNAGGWDFMTTDAVMGTDGEAILEAGCPILHAFDVVDAMAGSAGEVVADYIKADCSTQLPAGVAYTHATLGYQTVNLGFDIPYIMDGQVCAARGNYTPEGYFKTGIADRTNLIKNIMLYFEKTPTGDPTGVVDGMKADLSYAYPNPFNPVTKISYSIREAGPTTIEVYNIAGKVVRTLLPTTELAAGASGYVVWDGTDNVGEKCASGVYFYRLNAPGYTETQKMVMLK